MGSESTEAVSTGKRADRALGKSRADVIAAVDAARTKVAADKAEKNGTPLSSTLAAADPSASERRELRAIDRAPVGTDVDKAMGKNRDETVAVVDAATEALSEPPAETTTTEETAPAPDESKREGQLLAQIRQRERKLVEGQQRLRKDREELDSYKRRIEEELAAARESNALARQDPFAWFERYHGIRREAWGAVAGGKDPGPNVAEQQTQARIQQLEQALRAQHEQTRQRDQDAARQREEEAFVSEARAGSASWPLASKYTESKLKALGWQVALEAGRRGVTLSNAEVLDRIEEHLSEIASLRAPKSEAKPAPKAAKTTETTGSEVRPSQQPTLTTQGDADSAPTPRSPLKMKRHEMISETVRVLNELKAKK